MDEREFELVNIIGDQISINQRDLSRRMNLSLGMINMIMRRLISKGYIRINQLNKRKVEYILTPQGFSEKMKKSVRYTLKTIQSIGKIKDKLNTVLAPLVNQGKREFMIVGESDFALLVEVVLSDLCKDFKTSCVDHVPFNRVEQMILICKEGEDISMNPNQDNVFNLVEAVAKGFPAVAVTEENSI